MSGYSYRFLIEPALRLADKLDIGNNPSPEALYDARSGCINVWCTPEDNPGGDWNQCSFFAGAHCKPSDFVGTLTWEWDEDIKNITHFVIDTVAYLLDRELPNKYIQHRRNINGRESIYNRPEDLQWAEKKFKYLFHLTGLESFMVPVYYATDKDNEKDY